MLRSKAEGIVETREQAFGGAGHITIRRILNSPEEMYEKGRLFAHISILPGCGIGYHTHTGESETYYILSGCGEFDDNGSLVTVRAGDVAFTPSGQGHALINTGDEPLEFIALILNQ